MDKYFICKTCGSIVKIVVPGIHESTCCGKTRKALNVPVCCNEKMAELVANTTDAAVEKHVPSVEIADNKLSVVVGETIHPMTEAHYIMWIALETKNDATQIKLLKATDEPKATFYIDPEDAATKVYAYCNLHSLWVKEI